MGCACGSAADDKGSSKGESAPKAAAAPAKKSGETKIQMTPDGKERIVMVKYRMSMDKEAIMGEGTSSICRKGVNVETKANVAIKVYKDNAKANSKTEDVMMLKFKRQVEVLTELQEPFVEPKDPTLWHETLKSAKASSLFMTLTDYSKGTDGQPGADPADGVVYVITELAQYSLKDYLALRREQARQLPASSVKSISRAIILVVAGLHAKGLVHIDLKPENLMMFNGRLKLIDVDGCVKIGTTVSIQDSSISFSPCYCAPEWAQFLINESNSKITIHPALDVWSVGMTICELVTLNALLKPMYGNFLRNAHSHREAGFLFMDWLSNIRKVPLPKNVEKYDPEFVELIAEWLLVCDKTKRKSCAQALSHTYIKSAATKGDKENEELKDAEKDITRVRKNLEDDKKSTIVHQGALWKLNSNGDPQDNKAWLKRDIYIQKAGSLCYWSQKENKRLVLIDGSTLAGAKITKFGKGCKPHAFEIRYTGEGDDAKEESIVFASDSAEEYNTWQQLLQTSSRMDMPTMQLGGHVAEMRKFVISVKNRRQKVEEDAKDQFAPVFKNKLWKLKADGNRMAAEDWFEREMWVSKNGSLVYYSKKEERDLVYYTSADLSRATYTMVEPGKSLKPFTFQVHLPAADGVEFAPGDFAAESEALRQQWISELKKFSTK